MLELFKGIAMGCGVALCIVITLIVVVACLKGCYNIIRGREEY